MLSKKTLQKRIKNLYQPSHKSLHELDSFLKWQGYLCFFTDALNKPYKQLSNTYKILTFLKENTNLLKPNGYLSLPMRHGKSLEEFFERNFKIVE